MLRSSFFLSSTRPVFAAQTDAAAAKASRTRQDNDAAKPEKEVGPRAVYLKPEKTAADILVRLESYAEASLRFLSSIVVHMAVRTYSTVDTDRVADAKTLMTEIEGIIQEYAKGKRGGKAFEHAWTSRIMSTARAMAVKLIKDGKGVMTGPIGDILRSRTVETANDIVFKHCLVVNNGQNSFTALSKMLSPAKTKTKTGKGGAKPSNAVQPVKGTNASVAKRVLGETGFEVINAIPGKAVAKATKLADTIAKSNVDHRTFVLRALTMIDNPETLLEIAETARNMAAQIVAQREGTAEAKTGDLSATG